MKKGSALLTALFVIMVLSVIILSFAYEAHLQSGVNVYVRERNRVQRLINSGRIIAEVVLTGYKDTEMVGSGESYAEFIREKNEENRWYEEQMLLKENSACKIGPILLDEEDTTSGSVTIEIEPANSMGSGNGIGGSKIDMNLLYEGGENDSFLRWQIILRNHGVPDDEFTVTNDVGETVNFMSFLYADWSDWRDEDDNTAQISDAHKIVNGAEYNWYAEHYKNLDRDEDKRPYPANGEITTKEELAYVRAFSMYPAVLTGGLLYPDEEESEDNPRLTSIYDVLDVGSRSVKIPVNSKTLTVQQLLTIPGIFDDEDKAESMEIAKAIIDGRYVMPEDREVNEELGFWRYKDLADISERISEDLSGEIENYLEMELPDNAVFDITITGESLGMVHKVKARAIINDKKVRYIDWKEGL
jgi:hypothetical protein